MNEYPVDPNNDRKICRGCSTEKPLTWFTIDRKSGDGRNKYCGDCIAARSREYYQRKKAGLPPRTTRKAPLGYRHCPDCRQVKPLSDFPRNRSGREGRGSYCKPCWNIRAREATERLYGTRRNYLLTHRYGISEEQFEELKSVTQGRCWICEERSATHVDHDHETGEVRGVTCFTCNVGLGNFDDRPDLLDLAVLYLDPDFFGPRTRQAAAGQLALEIETPQPLGRPLTVAEYHRRYKYGLEPEERAALIKAQGGLCAICRENPGEHVDHDHETGEVRGMLCLRCNTGLGNFRDRADIVDRAITYLTDTYYQWRTA